MCVRPGGGQTDSTTTGSIFFNKIIAPFLGRYLNERSPRDHLGKISSGYRSDFVTVSIGRQICDLWSQCEVPAFNTCHDSIWLFMTKSLMKRVALWTGFCVSCYKFLLGKLHINPLYDFVSERKVWQTKFPFNWGHHQLRTFHRKVTSPTPQNGKQICMGEANNRG